MGQYLEFDLRSAAGDPTVEGVIIKFYQGNKMITLFEVCWKEKKWRDVLPSKLIIVIHRLKNVDWSALGTARLEV